MTAWSVLPSQHDKNCNEIIAFGSVLVQDSLDMQQPTQNCRLLPIGPSRNVCHLVVIYSSYHDLAVVLIVVPTDIRPTDEYMLLSYC